MAGGQNPDPARLKLIHLDQRRLLANLSREDRGAAALEKIALELESIRMFLQSLWGKRV